MAESEDSESFEKVIRIAAASFHALPQISRNVWNELFLDEIQLDELKKMTMLGGLSANGLRNLLWRIWLTVLPLDSSEWATQLQKKRRIFNDYLTMSSDSDRSMDNADDPRVLSFKDDGDETFLDTTTKSEIKRDLLQMRWGSLHAEFFKSTTTRKWITDILFIYAKYNSDFGYRPGMVEILGPLLIVTAAACSCVENFDGGHLARIVHDPEFIAHDTYWLFLEVMRNLAPCFFHRGKSADHPILKKTEHVQHTLLKNFDNELHMHFQNLNIIPQHYGLTWYKFVFSTTFPLHQLCLIWDGIFLSYRRLGVGFIDFIMASLLLQKKDKIRVINEDSELLALLLKYTLEDDSVWSVVERAIVLESSIVPNPLSSDMSLVQKEGLPAGPGDIAKFRMASTRKGEEESFKEAFERLQSLQKGFGERAEKLAQSMSCMSLYAEKSSTFRTILAELKYVRDVLNGDLEYTVE